MRFDTALGARNWHHDVMRGAILNSDDLCFKHQITRGLQFRFHDRILQFIMEFLIMAMLKWKQ